WQQRDPHAGGNTAEHRVIGGELDRAFGHLATPGVIALQPLAIGAAVLEREDGRRELPLLADRITSCRGYDHGLFQEREDLVEWRIRDRFCRQRRVELPGEDGGCELLGIADAKLERHLRIEAVIFV